MIAGGAGYIGSSLVKSLIDDGHTAVSFDNLTRGSYEYLMKYRDNPRLRLIAGDISNPKELEEIVSGQVFDSIVNLAAIPGLERCRKEPENAILTNVYGAYNLLEVAREYDINKIIFVSSAAVYGKPVEVPVTEKHPLGPLNLYGVTKLAGERIVHSYHVDHNLTTVILRLGNVYGVGVYTYWETVIPKFVKCALEGLPLTVYGTGEQGRDFIHVLDAVQAIRLASEARDSAVADEIFNVSGGKAASVNSIVELVRKYVGKSLKVERLPMRKGEPYILNFEISIAKIKNTLRFTPLWDVEKGIAQLVDYQRTGK